MPFVSRKVEKFRERLGLSEEKGWSLYGLETETSAWAGSALGRLVSAIFPMNLEYQEGVTEHFKHLAKNHQATLDLLRDL